MPVLRNIGQLAQCRDQGGQGEIQPLRGAALAWRQGTIRWVGPEQQLPASEDDGESWDAGGSLVVPGLIDCHTHLGFGGWRGDELVRRLKGESYSQIAASGGGIASTVEKTRALSEEALRNRCRTFLTEMVSLGVTCVEAKSGYGLDRQTELRLLNVYRALDGEGPARIVSTFLGAHVVPPEFRDRRGEYLARLIDDLIPLVARDGLARFCDVFVDKGAFSPDEARLVAQAARSAGLGLKLHVDQLADDGGALLAAELGAVSADHLEHVSPAGIAALAKAGVVAVSLPLAALYLGQPPLPARALIAAGVPVAVASDFNPGTAPSFHLPLAMTLCAARALGLERQRGSLEPGKAASFAVIDAPDVDHWLYHFRANACRLTVCDGVERWRATEFAR
jgi:imidazolonepropionase